MSNADLVALLSDEAREELNHLSDMVTRLPATNAALEALIQQHKTANLTDGRYLAKVFRERFTDLPFKLKRLEDVFKRLFRRRELTDTNGKVIPYQFANLLNVRQADIPLTKVEGLIVTYQSFLELAASRLINWVHGQPFDASTVSRLMAAIELMPSTPATPEPPPRSDGEEEEDKLALDSAPGIAWRHYQMAEETLGDGCTVRAAYDWLEENSEAEVGSFVSFEKAVGRAKKVLGLTKPKGKKAPASECISAVPIEHFGRQPE